MKALNYLFIVAATILIACGGDKGTVDPTPPTPPTPPSPEEPDVPKPDPNARVLYNGITLPATWPPLSSWSANIYAGMNPSYLSSKPAQIDITMGRQLFVDDFLIASTDLSREWHQAEYVGQNPVFSPEQEWEMMGDKGGGYAAPFSDGVWYDEKENKFKMWYMAGGKIHGNGNPLTCYAESTDGIVWTRPTLNLVSGTNIVHRNANRDSNSVWMDKTTTNTSQRFKMFNVYGGAGNWKYHYFTSSDGKAWREQNESQSIADRSTVFHNPFRGVWVWSMRHNVRVDASNLVRGRDYQEHADPIAGNAAAKADLARFWFGPWPAEPKHPTYTNVQPAIYNLDAIGYESVMLGVFSSWAGPENDVCASDKVIKRNQLLVGFSRDGWSWHRGDFAPFCGVSNSSSAWNFGNIQSAVGSPIIVGDKLYFYMSGRRFSNQGAEITSTGLATLRRDGFASMNGTGSLTTEKLKFAGKYMYINAEVTGSLRVEVLNADGNPISGFGKDDCTPMTGNSTKNRIQWKNNATLETLKGQTIRLRFHVENTKLYAFWISQFESGKSYGYTAGGGSGYSPYGIDL